MSFFKKYPWDDTDEWDEIARGVRPNRFRGGSGVTISKASIYFAIMTVMGVGTCAYQRGTVREDVICVLDKNFKLVPQIHTDDNGGTYTTTERVYLVHTNNGTYVNTPAIWYFKIGVEDLQGALEVGQLYTIRTYGLDVPGDFVHPNIVEITNHLGSCDDQNVQEN